MVGSAVSLEQGSECGLFVPSLAVHKISECLDQLKAVNCSGNMNMATVHRRFDWLVSFID